MTDTRLDIEFVPARYCIPHDRNSSPQLYVAHTHSPNAHFGKALDATAC